MTWTFSYNYLINYPHLESEPYSVFTLQMRIVTVSRGMSWIQGLANEGMQEQSHPDFSAIETYRSGTRYIGHLDRS